MNDVVHKIDCAKHVSGKFDLSCEGCNIEAYGAVTGLRPRAKKALTRAMTCLRSAQTHMLGRKAIVDALLKHGVQEKSIKQDLDLLESAVEVVEDWYTLIKAVIERDMLLGHLKDTVDTLEECKDEDALNNRNKRYWGGAGTADAGWGARVLHRANEAIQKIEKRGQK